MSALRVYAETGTRLLNTGPDVDDDTDTIRRLHKTGVKLHYESEPRRLRCYAQVRRTPTLSPEQVIFEYDPDPGADVFEAFVRDAEAAMEDASWQVLSDSSPAYEALKRGRRDTPDSVHDVAVGFKNFLKQLGEHGKRIDLVAADDGAGTGLARYVHGEFDGGFDVAVAGTGRTASVISDVDVVIVPSGSHTGVPERTVDRFKQIQLDEQTERLGECLDELSGRMGLHGLAAHLENEVIEPEEGITLRPPSARSWWKPDRSWLLGAVAVGLLAVVVYGGWTNRGRTVELLTRRVSFVVPGWIPGPVHGVVPSGVGLVSWWIVLAGSLAAVVSLGAVLRSRVDGSVEIEGSQGRSADDTAAQPDGDDDTTRVETDVNAPLAAIEETADRETRTERLADALEDRGIEVVSSDRTRKRYRHGPRLTGVAIALAVTVGLFVLNPIAASLAVVEAGWFLILEGFVALATIAVGGGVVVGALAVRERVVAAVRALRKWVVAALVTVKTKARPTGRSLYRSAALRSGIGALVVLTVGLVALSRFGPGLAVVEGRGFRILEAYWEFVVIAIVVVAAVAVRKRDVAALATGRTKVKTGLSLVPVVGPEVDERSDIDKLRAKVENGKWGYFTSPQLDVLLNTLKNDRNPELAELLLKVDEKPNRYPRWDDGERKIAEEVAAESGSEGTADPHSTDASGGVTSDPRSTDAGGDVTGDHQPASTVDSPKDASDTGSERSGDNSPGSSDRIGGTESTGGTTSTAGTRASPAWFRCDAANTGSVERATDGEVTEEWTYDNNTAAPTSPVVIDDTVYVVTRPAKILALDQDKGERVWDKNPTGHETVSTEPTTDGDRLYFGTKSDNDDRYHIYAFDVNERTVVWGKEFREPVSTPTEWNGRVFVGVGGGSGPGELRSFDGETGENERRKEKIHITRKPAVHEETIFVAGRNIVDATEMPIDSNELRWGWTTNVGSSDIVTPPTVTETEVFVATTERLVVLDREDDGNKIAEKPLDGEDPVELTVVGNRVFVGTESGVLNSFGFDRENGGLTDRMTQRMPAEIKAPLVADEGHVYVPYENRDGNDEIGARIVDSLARRWSKEVTGAGKGANRIETQPAHAGDLLLVARNSGTVEAWGID